MQPAQIDWYRSPIDKDTLQALTRRSDLKGWLQAGSFLLLYLGLTALALWLSLARLWVPMVVVGYMQFVLVSYLGLASGVHELSHGTPFRSRAVNETFLYLFSLLTWCDPIHLRASHVHGHHPYTLFRGRDKEVLQCPVREKLNWVNVISWLTFDFKWFAICARVFVLHALGNADADFFAWDPLLPPGDPRRAQICRWARVVLAFHLVTLVLFIVFHLWALIVLVTLGAFFGRIFAYLTATVQHSGLGESIPDWRAVCHTVRINPVLGYLYWHMNYHTEHHMFAAVPFYNLKRLRAALEPDMPPAHRGVFGCLRVLVEVMRKQESDPAYFYVPPLPANARPLRMREVPAGRV